MASAQDVRVDFFSTQVSVTGQTNDAKYSFLTQRDAYYVLSGNYRSLI